MQPRPNFFIVGAPRCGTTSLAVWLGQHPDVFIPVEKEPLHFCTDLIEESDEFHGYTKYHRDFRTRDRYLALFRGARPFKAVGEGSTWYLYSKVAAQNIQRFSPEARIIICLREPVGFLRSLHALFLSSFNETISSFQKAIEAESDRKKGRNIPETTTIPSRLYYTEVASFSSQIRRYIEVFGEERLIFVLLDDLRDAPAATYRRVLQFLELDEGFEPSFERQNPTQTPRFPRLTRVLKQPYRTFVPAGLRKYLKKQLVRMLFRPSSKPEVDPAYLEALRTRMTPEVRRLSTILRRNLMELWGY